MRRALTTSAVLGLVLTLAFLGLAGCGSSGGDKDNGIAAKSPADIEADVKAALTKAGSFRVSGSGEDNGAPIKLDLQVDTKGNKAAGSVTFDVFTLHIVRVGDTVYLRGPAAFFEKTGATPAQAALVADKWLKGSTSDPDFKDFSEITTVDGFLKPSGTLTKGEQTTIDGQQVLALVDDKGKDDETTMYVKTRGDALPIAVRSTGTGTEKSKITIGDFGAKVDATAPAGAVDLSQLSGG